ncbi:DinB family protein [Falsibacillus pallidus]|uniref:DinB family protein n=1 Tax=Falsibacillus pallidus TaxID=493781 RepID=A0A370GPL8_9BACI|nr:DinB family protein [Falsibacillus pallidus]RDI45675.1 DinB family protein [Falsibacillus pallidus]
MNKQTILSEKASVAHWAENKKSISNHKWFAPLKEGSWGTGDVISHFIVWDEFLLEHRLPYIMNHEPFPAFKIDVQKMNQDASDYARAGISKEQLIDEFTSIRSKLVQMINSIPEERFDSMHQIGSRSLTLNDYFMGLIEHDQKHMQEIDDFLNDDEMKQ